MTFKRQLQKEVKKRIVPLMLGVLLVSGCAQPVVSEDNGIQGEALSMDQLAQTDFNRTATIAMRDNFSSLYQLQEKLYKRNPHYWRAAGFTDVAQALQAGRDAIAQRQPPADLVGLQDIEILSVALDPAYSGDRIAAFIYGMADMILTAHNDKQRFYIKDVLSADHIYNAARNIEIAAWLLRSRKNSLGQPLLLTHQPGQASANLSFEREFGKIIGRLDLIANLLDENLRRVGIGYLQGLMLFSFLPVR